MSRSKEQNERLVLQTRKKIESAGLELFAQKGFGLTGIKDIAREAQISVGLIYKHFSSKEELFITLVKKTIDELTKVIERLDSSDSPQELLMVISTELIREIQLNNEISNYFLLVTRFLFENEAIPYMYEIRNKDIELFQETAKLIKKGQELGEFKEGDPYKYSLFYFSMIQGIANMQAFLKEEYIAPEPENLLAFLIK